MTRKKRRLYFIALGMLALGAATALVLSAIGDSLLYFYSPTDLEERPVAEGQRFRLGGLVEEGSVEKDGETVRFVVTDLIHTVPVAFTGILPDLFREGQGVVTEGRLSGAGLFVADSVLAKHDETYMPKEVADSLKDSGYWKEGAAPDAGPAQ
ncbi:cytochrome c maturation protein CcmE [Roseospira marina]|uniref:Cytochrome c-type biogenesis protein CcmE n=1 Tax=Roseospira marina TaxID=140057 RepID=A0A5M6IAW9_9PROT|nr:cytochrome c maturation protein CcmE [Roseospira marina]KAA5605097.1 cytochrome c maturation protein CcmE [Roseospira marina]MBB4314846.1 cytochrome c-type biogenesis protein CcmE [Roseospira marina]MBB5087846.1 cytochrome c-type biogenesis protein CcmE [Roseospira marina]